MIENIKKAVVAGGALVVGAGQALAQYSPTNTVDVSAGINTVYGYGTLGATLAATVIVTVIGLGALMFWGRKASKGGR